MFKKNLIPWVEEYLFFPTPLQQLISALLLPLTLLYCLIVSTKRILAKKKYFGIPVIGIGNLLVGGTGKTPVTIALAKDKKNVAVVLRGYGRQSKGLIAVSNKGKILTNVQQSGDEAMLLALSLPNAIVIVSQKREEGIVKAKELGAKLVFLDDGFSQYGIEKYDILVRPQEEPSNIFCLPSGGYREPKIMYGIANQVLLEGKDFKRMVTFKNKNQIVEQLPNKLVLITAISKPKRLLHYLPTHTVLEAFEDHYYFTQEDIQTLQKKYPNHAFITTAKDMVKLQQFNIANLYLMDLEIQFDDHVEFPAILGHKELNT